MADESRVLTVLVADSILFWFLILFLAVRLWVRFGILRSFDWDDGLVCLSATLLVALLASMMTMTNYGLGRHRDNVRDDQYLVFAKLNMVIACCYIWGFVTAKMSFAFLYFKVLPDRGYKRFNRVLLGFLLVQAWTPGLDGKCLNLTIFYYAVFAIKLITDLILFIEPIPVMWKLQLPTAKRIGLVAMLSLGLFVCIISIIRVTYVNFSSTDTTYSVTSSMVWSGVEVTALLICSCIPSLRPAVKQFPSINRALGLSSSDHSSGRYYGNSGSKGVSIALTSRPKDKYIQSQRANSHHSRVHTAHFGITSTVAPKAISSSAASTDEIFPHDVDKHGGILVTHDIAMAEERREIFTADDSMSVTSEDSITRPKPASLSHKKSENMSWLSGQ